MSDETDCLIDWCCLCDDVMIIQNERTTPYCEDFIFLICGQNPEWAHNLNQTRMEIYMSHTPSGTSLYNMDHWVQGGKCLLAAAAAAHRYYPALRRVPRSVF